MATVTMPDGSVVDMPDNLDPALGARLRAFQNNYKPPPPAPAAEPSQFQGVADLAGGVGDAALSGVTKVANSAVGVPISLANRLIATLTGGDSQIAADATHEYINRTFGHDTQTPVGKQIGATVEAALRPFGNNIQAAEEFLKTHGEQLGIPRGAMENMLGTTGDALGTAGVVAPFVGGAAASGEAAATAASTAAAKAPAASKYGLLTGEDSSALTKTAAGSSARPTVAAHNQARVDPILGAQAGVPPGTKIDPTSLETARAPANSVYQRVEQSLPTAPLSPAAADQVRAVNGNSLIVNSPDVQSTLEAQKARLLDGPLSGPDVVDAQKTLRYNGFQNIASEDPEKTALGRGQLSLSDALHQHMVDTLPPDAPVSADQLNAARVALAQNHTIENVLGPNGNINLTKLAKLHNDNPGMLTGPMSEIAQFASDHPEVTRLPGDEQRFNPPSVVKDLLSIDITHPVSSGAQALFGAGARRAIRSGTPPPVTTPVTGLGGEFGPIERPGPQPPPGMTASPPTAPAPPAAGPPGQIPLADLLSHGVEQQPAQGLSLSPEPSAPAGVPFARNAAHEAGPFSLVLVGSSTQSVPKEDNRDLGAVMSQGVPEGTIARTVQNPGLKMPVTKSPRFVANNASGESAASQEAINRGTSNLVEVDPDGNEHPVLRDVTQADREPSPNHLIVNKDTGDIVKSGGMAPALARGLLNRWKSRQLGQQF
jgi:hypothetical protein